MSAADKAEAVGFSFVKGMTSYVAWSDIEPVKGQYDFSRLDEDIAIARAAGKKITIGVFTGKNSIPSWVAADGVRMWTTAQGDTLIHRADQKFIALWQERLILLAARYDNDPTVIQVTICGPAGTLCGPRYPELPSDVTYAQLVDSWSRIISTAIAVFPKTCLNLEVQQTVGYNAQLPVDLFATIPTSVRIGPFAEFLSDTAPQPTSPGGIAFAAIASGRDFCGFQMVSPLGDKIDEAIVHGRSYGCSYFEIYTGDLKSQGAVLAGL